MSPQKLDVVLPDRVLVYARVKPASSGDSGEDELATSCDVEENVGTYEPALVKACLLYTPDAADE